MKTNNTTTTTPVTTADTTATTSLTDVIGVTVPFIAKTLAGIIAASAATIATGKLLKTGESQKKYEEAIKEFTAK